PLCARSRPCRPMAALPRVLQRGGELADGLCILCGVAAEFPYGCMGPMAGEDPPARSEGSGKCGIASGTQARAGAGAAVCLYSGRTTTVGADRGARGNWLVA